MVAAAENPALLKVSLQALQDHREARSRIVRGELFQPATKKCVFGLLSDWLWIACEALWGNVADLNCGFLRSNHVANSTESQLG